MSAILILQFIAFLSLTSLGLFVLFQKQRREFHWYFSLTAISTALWNLALFMTITEYGQPLLWGRLAISFGSFMPTGLFLFASSFPNIIGNLRNIRITLYTFGSIFFILPLSNFVVKTVAVVDNTYITGEFATLYFIFWLYYLGFLIVAFIKFIKRYKKNKDFHERRQLLYIITGFLTFFIPLLVTQFILPVFEIFRFNNLGPLFSLPMIGIFTYAIVRHQLMDIRVVIQKSLIYTALLSLTIGFYLALVSLFANIFHNTSNTSVIISAGITVVLGIFGIPPIERSFRKITDRWFFKDRYSYSQALHRVSEILNTHIDTDTMVHESIYALQNILKIQHISIYLMEDRLFFHNHTKTTFKGSYPEKYLEERVKHTDPLVISEIPYMLQNKHISPTWAEILKFIHLEATKRNITVTVPIILREKLIGVIATENKLSDESFTKKDLLLLKTFAAQAAVALEKARLYEQVQTHAKELEDKVAKRTQEIKALQKIQEQMIIDISHNLQTPLTILKGELEKIHRTDIASENLEVFEQSINRVSEFIYRLLQLAKSGNDKRNVTFSLSESILHAVEYFQTVATDQNITLEHNIQNNIYMKGNAQQIEELLINLVSNAIKYRRKDINSTVTIKLDRSLETKQATLSVQDNGIGIVDEDIPHIFTRFYRACNSGRLEDLRGTGLGLAISKKIVERHKGKISVDSIFGKGSTFTVTLPTFTIAK